MMHQSFKRKAAKSMAVIMMLTAVFHGAAAYIGPHAFSIPTGSTTWNGKTANALWSFENGDEATWSVNTNRDVDGTLYKIKPWGTDIRVTAGKFTPSNSGPLDFTPDTGVSYYAVLTRSGGSGASGTTSVTN